MADFKRFVFLDEHSEPFAVMVLGGFPWLCYWNESQKCFTTLRQIDSDEINKFAEHKLCDEQADLYFNYRK